MLSTLLLLPLIGALLVWIVPDGTQGPRCRGVAIAIAMTSLVLSIVIGFQFDISQSGFQFTEDMAWILSLIHI